MCRSDGNDTEMRSSNIDFDSACGNCPGAELGMAQPGENGKPEIIYGPCQNVDLTGVHGPGLPDSSERVSNIAPGGANRLRAILESQISGEMRIIGQNCSLTNV